LAVSPDQFDYPDAIDAVQPGSTIEVRNGRIEMFKGFMRLTVDKWGKIAKATEAATFNVNLEKNMSAVEYELVVEDEAAPTEAQ
jgi:replication factor A1